MQQSGLSGQINDAAVRILSEIANESRQAGLSGDSVRRLCTTVIVNLLNAAEVPMSGETIFDLAAAGPATVLELATLMGSKPTSHRSHYSIYPYPRPSLGGSASIFYEDQESGEPVMLLVRRQKDADQWVYPAGYMELLPDAEYMVGERVMPSDRHVLEEQTEGARGNDETENFSNQTITELPLLRIPSSRRLRSILGSEFQKLLASAGWDQANALMSNADFIRNVLAQAGAQVPAEIDVTLRESLLREIAEETGLRLSRFPQAVPMLVRMDVSLVYSSGGQRNYTGNPHFFVDLGTRAAPPELGTHQDEIVEAAWIRVRDVVCGKDGTCSVQTATPMMQRALNPYAIVPLQESLQCWFGQKIASLTGGEYCSIGSLRAAIMKGKLADRISEPVLGPALARLSKINTPVTPAGLDLTGPAGIALMNDYQCVASHL